MEYIIAFLCAAIIMLSWKVFVLGKKCEILLDKHASLMVATASTFGHVDAKFAKIRELIIGDEDNGASV